MKKVKCFIREESACHPGKYIIRPVYENFHLNSTDGSFNIICARLWSAEKDSIYKRLGQEIA